MKLLVAIDSSAQSEIVVSEVASRPWPPGTEVCVLTVVDLLSLFGGAIAGLLEPFTENENKAAKSLVQSVRERLAATGLNVTTKVLEDYPGTAIVDCARQWRADLILVGSHGQDGVSRHLLSSVARSVLHHAPCSVEVVRASTRDRSGEGRMGMKILLAVDGSDYSLAAVRAIAAQPWPRHSQIKVVSVVDLDAPTTDPWYAAGEVIDRIRRENTRIANEAVRDAQNILRDAGKEVDASVLAGKPKWRIVDEAKEWGADLIVVGSHGRRGMTRLLMGSVSETVAMSAHSSVQVIRDLRLLNRE